MPGASLLRIWVSTGAGEHHKVDARRVRALERELARKDKALAELAALVALKKKLELLWGDEDESTPGRSAK